MILPNMKIPRTSECVSRGHPDKACDQIADAILDRACDLAEQAGLNPSAQRTAIEALAKNNLVVVSGEIRLHDDVAEQLNVTKIVKDCWQQLGYSDPQSLHVVNAIEPQAVEISTQIDAGGAGDQGIMFGFACRETEAMMPLSYDLTRRLSLKLDALWATGALPFLKSDAKTQVSLAADDTITSVVVSTQHAENVSLEDLRSAVYEHAIVPVLGSTVSADICKINHKGTFTEGGAVADAGVVGRKIVIDAYGGLIPVGGGAFSGKDPSKVDRSAAYMARHIACALLDSGLAESNCLIGLSYGIGQLQPESVTAIVDGRTDAADWVISNFPDLSPAAIIERLGLWNREGWRYAETASYGHFGRTDMYFPWDQAAK